MLATVKERRARKESILDGGKKSRVMLADISLQFSLASFEAGIPYTHPLVKTFSNEVLPHAPSPLNIATTSVQLFNPHSVPISSNSQEHQLALLGLLSSTERHPGNRSVEA